MKQLVLLSGGPISGEASSIASFARKKGIQISVVGVYGGKVPPLWVTDWHKTALAGGGSCILLEFNKKKQRFGVFLQKEEKSGRSFPVHHVSFIREESVSEMNASSKRRLKDWVMNESFRSLEKTVWIFDKSLHFGFEPAWREIFETLEDVIRSVSPAKRPSMFVLFSQGGAKGPLAPSVFDWSDIRGKDSLLKWLDRLHSTPGFPTKTALFLGIRFLRKPFSRTPQSHFPSPWFVSKSPYIFFAASLLLFASSIYSVLQ